jgi:hypothetical protein
MWIRVESFEPSSSPPTTPNTTVLNVFAGRDTATSEEDDKGGGAILVSLGRKTGDVVFPNDKSVSRQHCAIRCIQKPRNDAERRACQNNPFQLCLVLDNFGGKAGTFLAETPATSAASAEDETAKNQGDTDDDETDDEGAGMTSQASSSQKTSRRQQLQALGDGTIVSAEQFPLSAAMRQFWKNKDEPPQMVRLEVGQSRVLDISDQNERRSILIQPGVKGSTLKITWVPFSVVFSRVPRDIHEGWKTKLRQLGALEEASITEATTHLITPNVIAAAKPLAACCRGIPIVTPDYLQALMDSSSSSNKKDDPLPAVEDYKAPFPEDGTMGVLKTKAADPNLMAGYVVFTLEDTEIETLIRFSGATLVALQDESNEKARLAKTKETLQTAMSGDDGGADRVFLVSASKKRLFSKLTAMDDIFSLKPSAWAKAIAQQEPKLADTKGTAIPLPSTTTKSSNTCSIPTNSNAPQENPKNASDDSDTEDEQAPTAFSSKQEERNANTDFQTQEDRTTTTAAATAAAASSTSRKRTGDDSNGSSQVDSSSMTELQLPSQKRRRRDETPPASATVHEEESSHHQGDTPDKQSEVHPQQETEREDFPVEQDVSMEEEDESSHPPEPPVKQSRRAEISSTSNNNTEQCLARPDSTGWFSVAPKDNAVRKAWRKKASKMNAEENDGKHFMPPAHSEHAVAIIPPPTSGGSSNGNSGNGSRDVLGRRPRRSTGPNFKGFRKNIVPRTVDACERISLQIFQARESEQQQRLVENQRELEEEQRKADELFRDMGAGTSKTRRRRQ